MTYRAFSPAFFRDILVPVQSYPRKPNLKLPQIEQKIGVNIEFNINPDFFFDFRGFKSVCVGVRLNRNQYITTRSLR